MSPSLTNRIPSISQQLHVMKKTLQDIAFDAFTESVTLDKTEVDDIEREASEVLRLIRSLKNGLSPINRIPPEVLTLIPDSWRTDYRDEDLIALTHVCRAWRDVFISRSSLWTNFDCTNAEKTRVYFKRSNSTPINLWLDRNKALSTNDPFFQIIPHSVGRLKSLSIRTRSENLQNITAHLSLYAPLLAALDINATSQTGTMHNPVLTTALFSGDLSSLHVFRLKQVRTELPWRNMVNLTSFALCSMPPGGISITQLLDFFEGAPHLCKIELYSATPVTGAQPGRVVSLARLKRMTILWGSPSSLLLDHLLIPVGAKLTQWIGSLDRVVDDHLPRSLDNLRNISNITEIHFRIGKRHTRMELRGPSGKLYIGSHVDTTCLGLESLAGLDTSKIERLEVVSSDHPLRRPSYHALLPLKNLRSLTLSRCRNPCAFFVALRPNAGVMACPKLEEIVLVSPNDIEKFDIESVIEIVAVRESRGAKLKTVRIIGWQDKIHPLDVLELGKRVPHVEYDLKVDVVDDRSDDDDEGFW